MTGLRARQKADRNRRILEAATTLFREQGYDAARIEDIAEMAEVSVGTLYNYYQNKGDVLVATVSMEVTEVLEAGESIVANPPLNVEEALRALIEQYYDHSLVYLSKEMWRTAMASSIQQPENATVEALYGTRPAPLRPGRPARRNLAAPRRGDRRRRCTRHRRGLLQQPQHDVHRVSARSTPCRSRS